MSIIKRIDEIRDGRNSISMNLEEFKHFFGEDAPERLILDNFDSFYLIYFIEKGELYYSAIETEDFAHFKLNAISYQNGFVLYQTVSDEQISKMKKEQERMKRESKALEDALNDPKVRLRTLFI